MAEQQQNTLEVAVVVLEEGHSKTSTPNWRPPVSGGAEENLNITVLLTIYSSVDTYLGSCIISVPISVCWLGWSWYSRTYHRCLTGTRSSDWRQSIKEGR